MAGKPRHFLHAPTVHPLSSLAKLLAIELSLCQRACAKPVVGVGCPPGFIRWHPSSTRHAPAQRATGQRERAVRAGSRDGAKQDCHAVTCHTQHLISPPVPRAADSLHPAAKQTGEDAPSEVLGPSRGLRKEEAGVRDSQGGRQPRPEAHKLPRGVPSAASPSPAPAVPRQQNIVSLRLMGPAASPRCALFPSSVQFRNYKVIYRRYAGLFFTMCVDHTGARLPLRLMQTSASMKNTRQGRRAA